MNRPGSPTRLLAALVLCGLAVGASPRAPRAGPFALATPPEGDAYASWSARPGGLDLRVEIPAFDEATEIPPGFDSFDLGSLRDLDQELEGLEALPVRWIRLPIPDQGDLALEVLELSFRDGTRVTLSGGDGSAGHHRGIGRHAAPVLEGSWAPPQPLSIDGVGVDGDRRFAYLRVMPVLRSLDDEASLVLESARARLHVGQGAGGRSLELGFSRRSHGSEAPVALPPATAALRVRVLVTEAGLQVLEREDLEAVAPELLSLPPERLRLTRDGREVARRVVVDALGQLQRVELVGSPRLGENEPDVFQAGDFTDVEVFFLEAADPGTGGLDLLSRSAAPSGEREPLADLAAVARLEEDTFFYNTVASADFDHWAWGPQLRSDGSVPDELAVPLDLPGLDVAGDGPVTLRVVWHGRGQPELDRPHRTELRLGEALLSRDDWEGFSIHLQQAETHAAAVAAAGELRLVVPGLPGTGLDGASIDHVLVGYRRLPVALDDLLDARLPDGLRRLRVSGFSDATRVRAFDMAAADRPVELEGLGIEGDAVVLDVDGGPLGRVVRLVGPAAIHRPRIERSQPADLLEPTAGADWLAVLPEQLAGSTLLEELVAARSSSGWSPRVIALEDLFDLFSFGRPDPRAVPRFLAHALASWPEPRPQVLVLLGDGSQDYKGLLDPGGNLVPAQLFSDPAERWRIGHHAGDSRAAAVHGPDMLPEVAVGRVPARTTAELDSALAKILAAEAPPAGDWRRRIVLVADDSRPADGYGPLVDALREATPSPYLTARLGGAAMLRDELPGVLADGGAAVLLYLGHGAIDRWAPPGAFGAPYLAPSEVPLLQPGGPWPVVVDGGSLFTGAYHHEAEVPALQEVLLLSAGAGSSGGIAPSGDLTPVQGRALIEAAHAALFGRDRVGTLGELAERVRRALDQLGGPRSPQAVAGLVVFGDPAMPLALPLPPAPPWLTARGAEAAIELAWTSPSEAPPGSSFRLYRATAAAGPYEVLAEGLFVEAHEDSDVEADLSYHYRVSLVDSEGFESPASNRAEGRLGEEGGVVVFGCLPDAGPLDGGQDLIIVGRGFQPGARGFLGSEECLSSTFLDEGRLECVSPGAIHPGLVRAAVLNPDLSEGERPRAYIYCPNLGRSLGPRMPDPRLAIAGRAGPQPASDSGDSGDSGDLGGEIDSEHGIEQPILRRPTLPRPDSFEPVIDPGLSRTIRFPKPSCDP